MTILRDLEKEFKESSSIESSSTILGVFGYTFAGVNIV